MALRQIHCAFMTITLRFYDATQVPAGSCVSWSSPAKTFVLRRVMLFPTDGARAKPRTVRLHRRLRRRRDRHLAAIGRRRTASGGAGDHVSDRNRFRRAYRLSALLGHPELLLHYP